MLALAMADVVVADDRLKRSADTATRAREAAIVELERAPDSKPVRKLLRALKRGNELPVTDAAELGTAEAALTAFREADAERARILADAQWVFDEAALRTTTTLQQLARDPRLREAMTWQNRSAVQTGVAALLRRAPEQRDSKSRQYERLIASWLQRYCVKNDTIGFFGPVAWGTVGRAPHALRVRPGPQLLDKRTVYFEHWCIDAIAQVISREPALRPYMRPRRMPTVRIDGTTVHYPVAKTSELPPAFARLLVACDGSRTAGTIARDLVADRALGIETEDDVLRMLEALADKHFVTWMFETPTVTQWPEQQLRALVEAIPPGASAAVAEARSRALSMLDQLEQGRRSIARAAGDPDALDRAMHGLEQTFVALTGQPATRKHGEAYAARTLVYEECRRDLELDVGARALDRLGPPLALVLQSARWYTHQIARNYRGALVAAFEHAAGGARSVDYLTYWSHAKALFPERGRSELVLEANAGLQERWSSILAIDPAERRVTRSSAAIAARVEAAFAAPQPGWPGARYHAPDVLVAATGVDAIDTDTSLFVMGELHPATSTMHFLAQKEHPDPTPLIRARELDLPPLPWQVTAKEHASRADHMWLSSHDVDIELGTTRSWRPRDQVIAVADLVVERAGDELVVRDTAGRWRFDIVEFFGPHLSAAIATDFDMLPDATHLPRLAIDQLVVVREQWRPPLDSITFAAMPSGIEQFSAARAWARALGMPRWVFVKIPEEQKPMYVDFDSPIYVEILAKALRKASRVSLSEMLPSPHETWLADAAGGRYVCELRLLAVDPVVWRPRRP
ncbi:MAG TPA: lantibiotic dehydratase [Kofleriaceae bacterium]|nr:lantibiotic dehydratase [Kofleriaceae bacterium]